MTLAYLVNQYPKISHSFIRREILALEALGVPVTRFAIRTCAPELVDEADRLELTKTRVVLQSGLKGLIPDLVRAMLIRPGRFLKALGLAIRVGRKSERGVLLHFIYLAEACVLLRWCQEADITHLHAHFGTNSTTVAMLCYALGGPPYSFTAHGPEEFDKAPLLALTEKINRARFTIAISSFGRSQLYRYCSYPQWGKIHIVHCGVDQKFLEQPLTPVPDVPQLVCIGRLSEQKGHLLLVQAAGLLARENIPFKLVLVGDGELRSAIESLAAQVGAQNHIEITGWANTDQVQQHLLASRAMVQPSFAEGLPVVIMEALALGRPVLSTYVAGIPELVEPGVCGWLVPPGSVEGLAQAMKTVLQTPIATLQNMGQVGRDRVQAEHDALKEAQKLAQLVEQC